MKTFSEFCEDTNFEPRDPGTHNLDGTEKTPEEKKVFAAGVAKLKKRDAQRARRSRLRKAAHEYGSDYKA